MSDVERQALKDASRDSKGRPRPWWVRWPIVLIALAVIAFTVKLSEGLGNKTADALASQPGSIDTAGGLPLTPILIDVALVATPLAVSGPRVTLLETTSSKAIRVNAGDTGRDSVSFTAPNDASIVSATAAWKHDRNPDNANRNVDPLAVDGNTRTAKGTIENRNSGFGGILRGDSGAAIHAYLELTVTFTVPGPPISPMPERTSLGRTQLTGESTRIPFHLNGGRLDEVELLVSNGTSALHLKPAALGASGISTDGSLIATVYDGYVEVKRAAAEPKRKP